MGVQVVDATLLHSHERSGYVSQGVRDLVVNEKVVMLR